MRWLPSRRGVAAVLVIAAGGIMTSCVRQPATVRSTSANTPDSAPKPDASSELTQSPDVVATFTLLSTNALANESDAAFVGNVTDLSAAKWNSETGAAWQAGSPGGATPLKFREVNVVVNEVIYSDSKVPITAGASMKVVAIGDGTPTGAVVSGPGFPLHFNQISGDLVAGSEVLFVVIRDPLPSQNGSLDVVKLLNSYQGSWTIDSTGTAHSLDPRRTVPVHALKASLHVERLRGRQDQSPEEAAKTEHNPLG